MSEKTQHFHHQGKRRQLWVLLLCVLFWVSIALSLLQMAMLVYGNLLFCGVDAFFDQLTSGFIFVASSLIALSYFERKVCECVVFVFLFNTHTTSNNYLDHLKVGRNSSNVIMYFPGVMWITVMTSYSFSSWNVVQDIVESCDCTNFLHYCKMWGKKILI